MKRLIVIPLLLICVGLTGCGKGGASSPQAVFDRATKAAEKGEWKTFYECIDPEKSDLLLLAMTFGGEIESKNDKNAEAEFRAICTRHGIGDLKNQPGLMMMKDEGKANDAAHQIFAKVSD